MEYLAENDLFYDASDKPHLTEDEAVTVATVRSDVMPYLDKLAIEEASDSLYSHLKSYNRDRETVVEKMLQTNSAHLFFKANSDPRDARRQADSAVKFTECVKKLTSYAVTLLKPEPMRPDMWDRISVNSHAFEESIALFKQTTPVLAELGYTKMGANFIYKKSAKVSLDKIKQVCFDLLLLTAYMEVKLGIERSMEEVVSVPERSDIMRTVEPVKPGSFHNCDMCSQCAEYFCETTSSPFSTDCLGKAWCKPCNDKWHTNNDKRKDHQVVPLRPPSLFPNHSSNQQQPTTQAQPAYQASGTSRPVSSPSQQMSPSPSSSGAPLLPSPESKFVVAQSADNAYKQQEIIGQNYQPNVEQNHQPLTGRNSQPKPELQRSVEQQYQPQPVPQQYQQQPYQQQPYQQQPYQQQPYQQQPYQQQQFSPHQSQQLSQQYQQQPLVQQYVPQSTANQQYQQNVSSHYQQVPMGQQLPQTAQHQQTPISPASPSVFQSAKSSHYSRQSSGYSSQSSWSSQTAVNRSGSRPVPRPRQSRSSLKSPTESGTGSESAVYSPLTKQPPVTSEVVSGSQNLLQKLETQVNQLIASGNIALIGSRVEMFVKSIADVNSRIKCEVDHEKKARLLQELLKLNKQKLRLEDKLDELEMEHSSRVERGLKDQPIIDQTDQPLPEDEHNPAEEFLLLHSEPDPVVLPIRALDELSPLSYLKCIAEAESDGYTIDEILLGILFVPFPELNRWLRNSYVTMIDGIQQAVDVNQHEYMYCVKEIKNAFVSYGLEHPEDLLALHFLPVVDRCARTRQDMVREYCDLFNDPITDNENEFFKTVHVITPEMVNEIIYQANGDQEEILWHLNDKVAAKIREFIWKPIDPEDMEPVGVAGNEDMVLKQAIQILENPNIDEGVKALISYAELGLSHARTDQLLWIMQNLHGKDDRDFDIRDALIAVKGASDANLHEETCKYLSNTCSICLYAYPTHKMANLFCHDTSREGSDCCRECTVEAFTFAINSQSVSQFSCPGNCGAPATEAPEGVADVPEDLVQGHVQVQAHRFFEGLLSIVFPNIGLSEELIAKFSKKLTCWKMSTDRNFYWCQNPECSREGFGFIDEGQFLRIVCPECREATCRKCRKKWVVEHEDKTCEEFATWGRENTDEYRQGEALGKQLIEDQGIQCPKCTGRFYLAKGGCMDCVCLNCKFQFCSGCGMPYFKNCPKNEALGCNRLGLHAHHPRNCHMYLRDYAIPDLKQLLSSHGIEFEHGKKEQKCTQIMETDDQKVGPCEEDEEESGMCYRHYKEYLTAQININKLEVLPLLVDNDMIMELKRNGEMVPEQEGLSDGEYRECLTKEIEDKLPFRDLSSFKNF